MKLNQFLGYLTSAGLMGIIGLACCYNPDLKVVGKHLEPGRKEMEISLVILPCSPFLAAPVYTGRTNTVSEQYILTLGIKHNIPGRIPFQNIMTKDFPVQKSTYESIKIGDNYSPN